MSRGPLGLYKLFFTDFSVSVDSYPLAKNSVYYFGQLKPFNHIANSSFLYKISNFSSLNQD